MMDRTPIAQACKPAVAALVHVRNPFAVSEQDAKRIEIVPGLSVADLAMPIVTSHPRVPITVAVNGVWYRREDWHLIFPTEGDIITVVEEVQGGGGGSNVLRSVLQIAAMVAIAAVLGPEGAIGLSGWQYAAATVVANLAVNALLNNIIPASRAVATGKTGSSTYDFALQGNASALDEPIPVGYGYLRTFPKYVGQPYREFDNSTNDEYFFAPMCIGQGEYEILGIEIDDTPLAHFTDISYNVIAPGGSLSLVAANVVTSAEISSAELTATIQGPYAACGPGFTVGVIGIDIVIDGLGHQNGSSMDTVTVTVRTDAQVIDNYNHPIGAWVTLGKETIAGATTSQLRRSFKYDVNALIGTGKRVQVRCVRVDTKDDSLSVANAPKWAGMRAYLNEPAPLADSATYLEVKAKASEQLSGLSQRKIAVVWRRKLRTWNPSTGWSAVTPTRSIAWAIADMLSSTVYGDKLPDNRIDLQTLYELDQVWSSRQDSFDHSFESALTVYDACNVAAKAGRAVCIPRGGVMTVMRDQLQTLPVAVYTPRNMIGSNGQSSFMMPVLLPTTQTPDGVIIRYFDNTVWDWRRIVCPVPGVTTPVKPQLVTLEGVGGHYQANREGLYMAADTFYRRMYPTFDVELDAMLPAYGALVGVGHDLPTWGISGDVADWNAGTLTMTLTEPVQFATGSNWIWLQKPDGSRETPILCTAGADQNTVILAAAPSFTPIFSDAGKDRTRFVFGTSDAGMQLCRTKEINWKSLDRATITTVVEDNRVHQVDNALLPGPGDIQDPVRSLDNTSGGAGGSVLIVTLGQSPGHVYSSGADYIIASAGYAEVAGTQSAVGVNDSVAGYRVGNDGYVYLYTHLETFRIDAPVQWLNIAPATAAQCAGYEVRATLTSGATQAGDSTGSWLNLGTTRSWEVQTYYVSGSLVESAAELFVEIRDVATGLVQGHCRVVLQANLASGGGG